MPGGFRRKRARDEQRVRVDGNGLMRAVVGDAGLGDDELEAFRRALDERSTLLDRPRRSAAAVPIATKAELRRTVDLADEARGSFDDLVVLASGPPALALRALTAALAPSPVEREPARPALRIHVLDRPDPERCAALLAGLDLKRTLFNVISVNGDTLGTTALFLVMRDRLLKELGALAYQRHVVVATGTGAGALRQIVHDEGFRDVPLPNDIDDDRALLTAATLFPAACAGVDVGSVVAGATAMMERCGSSDDAWSPAHLLAMGILLAGPSGLRVVPPAATALDALAAWIERRCLDEALPAALVPAVRRVALFCTTEPGRHELEVPKAYQDLESVGYLGGQGLGTLAEHARTAAEIVRWSAGAPSLTLLLPSVEGAVIGQVFALVEAAVALAGATTDPVARHAADRLAYGLAGRPGYEAERAEAQRFATRREARYVA